MNTKREAWDALQQHTPELIPFVRELAERFGIDAVEVEADGERIAWHRSETP